MRVRPTETACSLLTDGQVLFRTNITRSRIRTLRSRRVRRNISPCHPGWGRERRLKSFYSGRPCVVTNTRIRERAFTPVDSVRRFRNRPARHVRNPTEFQQPTWCRAPMPHERLVVNESWRVSITAVRRLGFPFAMAVAGTRHGRRRTVFCFWRPSGSRRSASALSVDTR